MTNSKFKRTAKKHQVSYRKKNISTDFDTYATYLSEVAGKTGKNFYEGFEVFAAVKQRYPNFYTDLYSDMLRSEHIPFNLFIPLRSDLEFCKNVFNELLNGCIKSIDKTCIIDNDNADNIRIEFAPKPKDKYLDDGTSFDTYIEYTHIDNSKGILGIEVKYTEKEYKLKSGSTEEKVINDKEALYYKISRDSKIYQKDKTNILITDNYRQVWRNQLLAESIRLKHNDKFKHSSSLTFYPADNGHFAEISEKYIEMLNDKQTKFIPVTYEKYFLACYKHCPNSDYKSWIDYLTERYIVTSNDN